MFCLSHNLMLANTMFESDLESTWTFRGPHSHTQIDYIALDQRLSKRLVYCCVENDADRYKQISDHHLQETFENPGSLHYVFPKNTDIVEITSARRLQPFLETKKRICP